MDKSKLIEHILKSDLTAIEKRYLEHLVYEEKKRYLPECPCCGAKNGDDRVWCAVCGARMDNKHE